jgi:predicted nuclease of predicted toxin-antitoxin system
MELLANENIPKQAVDALRADGHDVAWIRTESPGIDDSAVLARARAQGRILLTMDKDFGELAFHSGLAAPAGIILLRLSAAAPEILAERLRTLIAGVAEWQGRFSVVEEDRIRVRPLPPAGTESRSGDPTRRGDSAEADR